MKSNFVNSDSSRAKLFTFFSKRLSKIKDNPDHPFVLAMYKNELEVLIKTLPHDINAKRDFLEIQIQLILNYHNDDLYRWLHKYVTNRNYTRDLTVSGFDVIDLCYQFYTNPFEINNLSCQQILNHMQWFQTNLLYNLQQFHCLKKLSNFGDSSDLGLNVTFNDFLQIYDPQLLYHIKPASSLQEQLLSSKHLSKMLTGFNVKLNHKLTDLLFKFTTRLLDESVQNLPGNKPGE